MNEEIANRLAQAREQRGYKSAREAALKLGWQEQTYRAHEKNRRGVPLPKLKKYARAFGVSLNWLLTGKGDKLARDEFDLLETYRDLPDEGKEAVRGMAETLKEFSHQKTASG